MTSYNPEEILKITQDIKNSADTNPDFKAIIEEIDNALLPLYLCDSSQRIETPIPAQEARITSYRDAAISYLVYEKLFPDPEDPVVILDAKRKQIYPASTEI